MVPRPFRNQVHPVCIGTEVPEKMCPKKVFALVQAKDSNFSGMNMEVQWK